MQNTIHANRYKIAVIWQVITNTNRKAFAVAFCHAEPWECVWQRTFGAQKDAIAYAKKSGLEVWIEDAEGYTKSKSKTKNKES